MFETVRTLFIFVICIGLFLALVTVFKEFVLPVMNNPGGVVPDNIPIPGK